MERDKRGQYPFSIREGMANLFAVPRRNAQVDLKESVTAVLLWGPIFAVLAAIVASAFTTELHVIAIYATAGFLSSVMAEALGSYLKLSFFWGQLIAGLLFFGTLFVTYLVVGSSL